MKNEINYTTGQVTFTPESHADRVLLMHLMNCADLREFSMYIEHAEKIVKEPMTSELGVSASDVTRYPIITATVDCITDGKAAYRTVNRLNVESRQIGFR